MFSRVLTPFSPHKAVKEPLEKVQSSGPSTASAKLIEVVKKQNFSVGKRFSMVFLCFPNQLGRTWLRKTLFSDTLGKIEENVCNLRNCCFLLKSSIRNTTQTPISALDPQPYESSIPISAPTKLVPSKHLQSLRRNSSTSYLSLKS